MRRVSTALIVGMVALAGASLASCDRNQSNSSNRPAWRASSQHAVAPADASPPDDGNWVMPGKDYASTRFSGLTDLTPANVKGLGVAFTFSTATTHGYEAPPLVVDGTMYLITPYPNNLYAL